MKNGAIRLTDSEEAIFGGKYLGIAIKSKTPSPHEMWISNILMPSEKEVYDMEMLLVGGQIPHG